MFSKRKLFIISIGLLFIFAFKQADDYFEVSKNLEIFGGVYKEIHTGYVDDIKPGELMKKGIDAMLGSLDPYTNFYTESQAEDAMIMRSGEYGGIGCSSVKRGDYQYINIVYRGLAADKAGLRVGDKLIEVNGKNFVGKSLEESSDALRGSPNTKVVLTIERDGIKKLVEITREDIKLKNVSYFGLVNAEIGYIKLDHFMMGAAKEVKDALVNLKQRGVKNIVLDLRDNGGGLLHEAVSIVNIFIGINQIVVTTKGRADEAFREYKTLDQVVDATIPLVVLVNSHSASASEIVCGAIQDFDRGVVIGRNTFGKGLVQNTKGLPYGTQMKLTIAKYYIPSNRCIQLLDYSHRNPDGSAGIVPDSLRKAFKTKSGRVVYDGGGVKPDVLVAESKLSNLSKNLEKNYLIFDFATHYRNEHEAIADISNFKISEKDFVDFKNFITTQNFNYFTNSETALKLFKEKVAEEDNLAILKNEIESIENSIKKIKMNDLEKNKVEIMTMLSSEIARRYYYEEAVIESTFNSDKDVLKSINLLNDLAQYLSILTIK
ncbi:MAG: S41 family peptidase [bacterium]|nr:S41 family peptidase [bacterium]